MTERLQVRILGIVQGVGFRPFVFRLATELELTGWILNDDNGVLLEVEGPHGSLMHFLERLHRDKPPAAFLYAMDHRSLAAAGYQSFEIRPSESKESLLAWILPDLSVCEACRKELFDSGNRRYRYPFINCTHCGPRFTIIEGLPYDRPLTTMKSFTMCSECDKEYHDPLDRRFHAQPNACPGCGPQLEFRDNNGQTARGEEAINRTVESIRNGKIIAVKGIGGFHLMLDARNEVATAELRQRKKRQRKPLAVMYPDLSMLKRHVYVPSFAETQLENSQAPILLLSRTKEGFEEIADSVAPSSPYLGVYLPYTPLHLVLLHDLGFPVIATSGNITEEPIEFEDEAVERMSPLCDGFLVYNRQIVRHADDSVIHVITRPETKPQMLRRARGYTPFPILAPRPLPPLLALGGHMNATFALSRNYEIILSQHLGDLDGFEPRVVYRRILDDFLRLYKIRPDAVIHDLHPDYFTTHLAEELGFPRIAIQHHHAHLAACLLENQCEGPVLGFTWDGTGYGPDHTVWGGEFLLGDARQYERVATLFPFQLPGGEKSIKEPWRTALSLLWEVFGHDIPDDLPLFQMIDAGSIDLTKQILQKQIQSPVTTSMGRLFDGISAILGLSFFNTHQAESAQLLEYAAWRHSGPTSEFPIPLLNEKPIRLDWRPMVLSLVERFRNGTEVENLAASFHVSLVQAALQVAGQIEISRIAMTGGVFCNRYLTENMLMQLQKHCMHAYIHSQLPPTDGSIAAGQLWAAANLL